MDVAGLWDRRQYNFVSDSVRRASNTDLKIILDILRGEGLDMTS